VRCFIVGADPNEGARLSAALASLGHPASDRPSVSILRADPQFLSAPRAIVLIADPSQAFEGADLAGEAGTHAFVVLVADTVPPQAYKALVRTGSGEWIQWTNCEAELADLVQGFSIPSHEDGGARIVSFLPSKGGVGNTTLAIEVAIHLATGRLENKRRRGDARVALLDLNLQGGTLAHCLDLEPRFDIAEISGRPERLDEQLVEIFTSRYANRIDVFASPTRQSGDDEIGPGLIFTFIDAISSRYDVIVLDLPQYWLAWTDTLIHGSDVVVVTGGATVPALRRLTARLSHITELGVPKERRAAAINEVGTDLLGRFNRRTEIERVLEGHKCAFIRRDVTAVEEAADSGRPVLETAPDSRIGRDIRRLADWIKERVDRSAPTSNAGDSKRAPGKVTTNKASRVGVRTADVSALSDPDVLRLLTAQEVVA
jgi:pilus assembly protein CpaE